MKWKKGQRYRDQFGYTHEVVGVRRDGMALVVMPGHCSRPLTQKEIPTRWKLLTPEQK